VKWHEIANQKWRQSNDNMSNNGAKYLALISAIKAISGGEMNSKQSAK